MLDTYSNEVQERLTIVATIFLPLTVLTGFFGMNFNWMIDNLSSAWAFFALGVGGPVAACRGSSFFGCGAPARSTINGARPGSNADGAPDRWSSNPVEGLVRSGSQRIAGLGRSFVSPAVTRSR